MGTRITFTKNALQYVGDPPESCQICKKPIKALFVDGKIACGPWANMCITCHNDIGVGLGTGHGQLFSLDSDGIFRKAWG